MRNLAVAMALATTVLASPAVAKDKAWYVGVEGGAMIVEDVNLDIAGINNAVKVDHHYGYDVDGIIGYDFGPARLEAEVGYRSANITGLSSTVPVPVGNVTVPGTRYNDAGGTASALSFMVNGMFDFGDDDSLNGFIGGGVGVARAKFNYAVARSGGFLDDSDTKFAWQVIAGIRAPLTDRIDVGLKYRYFTVNDVKLVDSINRDVRTSLRTHSVLGSLIFNFGDVAPPPPPEVVCTPGPYIVFFEWDKADITPEAASILDNAVTAYGSCGQAQVMVAGYTDTSGTPRYNLGLSERRAAAVSNYLQQKGVPDGVISAKGYGETNLRVETADGVRELQNRRVEITYGPGSGN